MFPVMFAVNTCPRERKLTASTRPVTAVIPSSTYGRIESTVSALHIIQLLCSAELKLVAGPYSPIVEVASRLCLLQETARIKDSVVGLEPQMTSLLPTNLRARSVSDVARLACIAGADQASRYV